MNIRTATNYEINRAIAMSLKQLVKKQVAGMDYVWFLSPDHDRLISGADYCNDWSDAGPLMYTHGIALREIETPGQKTRLWEAKKKRPRGECDIKAFNSNPLRAVMEVILEMQEIAKTEKSV